MDFYELIAKGYNELYGEEQKLKLDIIKENLDIKNTDLLLDVGCGIGYDFNCKVVGIDPSIGLLQQNTNNKNKKILAKAEHMPFKDKVFDKVISVTSMHNFDNIKKGISEMKRVGKKYFAFSVLKKTKHFDLIEKEIKNDFKISKIFDGKQDWIFICTKGF